MANGYGDYQYLNGQTYARDADQGSRNDGDYHSRTASPENDRMSSSTVFNPYYTGSIRPAGTSAIKGAPIDRQEIIKRIKNGNSRPTSPEIERPSSRGYDGRRRSPVYEAPSTGDLDTPARPTSAAAQHEAIGMQIERPRSALHRGDFRQDDLVSQTIGAYPATNESSASPLSTSPVAPWHPRFPSAVLKQMRQEMRPPQSTNLPILGTPRARAISTTLSSGFVYKPPTSPLVQSSRPDTPEPGTRRRSRSPDKSRRHTFSPPSFQRARSDQQSFPGTLASHTPSTPSLQSSRTFPYQAHQPRRSFNANSFQSIMRSPQAEGRRPSLSDSPLHHAPMVGSYEESILRGRMSTTPSKPLNFVAQIGVLGKGDCKPSLRCPPHASVAFPAVFYSYGLESKLISNNDQPSPYVGLIDLENNLASNQPIEHRRSQLLPPSPTNSRAPSSTRVDDHNTSDGQAQRRRRHKQKRRSCSPRAPPGGSYRIPQQGQLQIVIKNPNKTAVKLFLVPYDLSDMEPGQKTFIRQRSYSAGPIIDMPLAQRKNLGTDRPEASLSTSEDPNERPVLRYLIHLHMCCTSKGRYYLYKSIRVVFANRVPDGKEKLRNEIQLPEPRYSIYKPGRTSLGGTASGLGMSKTTPRRSSSPEAADPADEPQWSAFSSPVAQSCPSEVYKSRYGATMVNHGLNVLLPTLESRPGSGHNGEPMSIDSPSSMTFLSPRSTVSSSGQEIMSPKRVPQLQDPFTFDRDRSRERLPKQRNESILARRLMDLAFQGQERDIDGNEGA